jgi:hypothetical protein
VNHSKRVALLFVSAILIVDRFSNEPLVKARGFLFASVGYRLTVATEALKKELSLNKPN